MLGFEPRASGMPDDHFTAELFPRLCFHFKCKFSSINLKRHLFLYLEKEGVKFGIRHSGNRVKGLECGHLVLDI